MTRRRANGLLLLTAFIWGTAFVAQSTAMASLGPFAFVGLRFALGALVLLPFAIWEARRYPGLGVTRDGGWLLLTGLVLFAAAVLQQAGLVSAPVTNTAFFTSLYVVIAPFLAFPLYGKAPHPVVWVAAPACVFGVWAVGGGSLTHLTWGDGLVIIGAVFWALHVILVGRVVQRTGRPLLLACVQFFVTGSLALLCATIFEGGIAVTAVRAAWVEILYAGLLSTGVAFTLQIYGQRHTHPTDAAILLSAETLFAALAGALLLGERLPLLGWFGCAVILAAILAVEIIPSRKSRLFRKGA